MVNRTVYYDERHIFKRLCEPLDPKYLHMYLATLLSHPEFYQEFEKQALDVVEDGHEKWSARLIAQTIRWSHGIKFSDPVIAYYARKFISCNPVHRHLFQLNKLSYKAVDSACIRRIL